LWMRLTTTLAEARLGRPARTGPATGRPRPGADPGGRRRPADRSADSVRHSVQVDVGRGGRSRPPPSIRARSSSSLTIWTRWPVSTSIFAIRSRILGGTALAAASASRARVSASRLTVDSGVRSSWERVCRRNSVRICWSRRQLRHVLETIQTPRAASAARG
jgi:hypothetical protein